MLCWPVYRRERNNTAQQMMRQDWKEGMTTKEVLELSSKILIKTMDTASPNAEKLEFGILKKESSGQVVFRYLSDADVNKLMADAAEKAKAEQEEKAEAKGEK